MVAELPTATSPQRRAQPAATSASAADIAKQTRTRAPVLRHAEASSSTPWLDTTAVLLALVVVAMVVQTYAPDPYMDEPFHVQQTEQYCYGKFAEWDPKITTFPGLYFVGAALGRVQHEVLQLLLPNHALAKVSMCGTATLRSVNVAFGAACFTLSRSCYRRLHPDKNSEYATQMALMTLLLPTNFFYIFLYYTDIGSLAFVLASLLAALNGRYALSGLAAGAAVLFRQTNAVWAVFVIVAAVLRKFFSHNSSQIQEGGLAKQIVITLKLCWLNRWWLLRDFWPLALVPTLFAAFVVWNKGIVVGDRANHTPVLHLVQPLYFLLFSAAALAHIHFHPSRLSEAFTKAAAAFRKRPASILKPAAMAFVLATYAVHEFTMVHPFLLADNRHYTFYLWKDIIAPYPAAKYCLIPLYLYAGWSMLDSLRAGIQLDIWILGLASCMALTLVPAWLLELRYFTTPAVLVMLHMRPPSSSQLLLSLGSFAAVNAAVLYLFLFRPFVWPDGSIARFIW